MHSTRSEDILIGALLLDHNHFKETIGKISADDFENMKLRRIFFVMDEFYDRYQCFDIPLILDEITYLEEKYLYFLSNNCLNTSALRAHISIIKEQSQKRQNKK